MLLRVVAVRHAKPQSEGYADETLRPLSEEGISIQNRVTQHLKELDITPNIILSSPLIRAQETAHIISGYFDNVPIITVNALGYDFDSNLILSHFPHPKENQTVYLVGHTPTLGDFVNRLVGEIVIPTGLSKSSAAIVDFREAPKFGSGEFVGYYTPQSL
jgi:phosphohistidine phosphatase